MRPGDTMRICHRGHHVKSTRNRFAGNFVLFAALAAGACGSCVAGFYLARVNCIRYYAGGARMGECLFPILANAPNFVWRIFGAMALRWCFDGPIP